MSEFTDLNTALVLFIRSLILKVSLQPPSSFFLVVEQQLVETTTTCHAL
jgi:hypothetical protein